MCDAISASSAGPRQRREAPQCHGAYAQPVAGCRAEKSDGTWVVIGGAQSKRRRLGVASLLPLLLLLLRYPQLVPASARLLWALALRRVEASAKQKTRRGDSASVPCAGSRAQTCPAAVGVEACGRVPPMYAPRLPEGAEPVSADGDPIIFRAPVFVRTKSR